MQALKFNLSGKTAIFKRPDVNAHCLFTYSHIHKPALLGLLGAICGFGGYNKQKMQNSIANKEKAAKEAFIYPEFYEKLKEIKVSIVPKKPTFVTKKQNFNNSVGYASFETGNNLIVCEQWLENPFWEIFILLDETEITKELKNRLLKREFVFIPYLGKNDHFANIDGIEIVDLNSIQHATKIHSLIFAKNIEKVEEGDEDAPFKYAERLPFSLNKEDNLYELEKFVFTNMDVTIKNFEQIYSFDNRNLAFF